MSSCLQNWNLACSTSHINIRQQRTFAPVAVAKKSAPNLARLGGTLPINARDQVSFRRSATGKNLVDHTTSLRVAILSGLRRCLRLRFCGGARRRWAAVMTLSAQGIVAGGGGYKIGSALGLSCLACWRPGGKEATNCSDPFGRSLLPKKAFSRRLTSVLPRPQKFHLS